MLQILLTPQRTYLVRCGSIFILFALLNVFVLLWFYFSHKPPHFFLFGSLLFFVVACGNRCRVMKMSKRDERRGDLQVSIYEIAVKNQKKRPPDCRVLATVHVFRTKRSSFRKLSDSHLLWNNEIAERAQCPKSWALVRRTLIATISPQTFHLWPTRQLKKKKNSVEEKERPTHPCEHTRSHTAHPPFYPD